MKKVISTIFISLTLCVLSLTLTSHLSNISGNTTGCSCHGSATNSPTNIFISGLPDTVVSGQKYLIALNIVNNNTQNWGFDMGVADSTKGVFSTSNLHAKATSTGKEVRHYNSAPTAPGNSYVFDSIWYRASFTPGTVTINYAGLAGNGQGNSGGDKAYKGSRSIVVIAPLPLKFISINASVNNKKNIIKWITSNEISLSRFDIEKSINGVEFNKIGSLQANNIYSVNQYNFTDENTTAKSYYRIKAIDIDGKVNISPIAMLSNKTKKENALEIYPNPVSLSNVVKLKYNSIYACDAKVNMYDLTGKLVYSKNQNVVEGSNEIIINTSNMIKGSFTVSIISATGTNISQLVIQ